MLFRKIGEHKMRYCGAPAMISTVELSETVFETMVMFEDGEEIESFRTNNEFDARKKHNETVQKWNDIIYSGSIERHLGFGNWGQFVKPIKMC